MYFVIYVPKKDYLYTLPKDLIAESAVQPHHDAKLMVLDRSSGTIKKESTFWSIPDIIPQNRVIYFNNSRVLRARITLKDNHYFDRL